jgi:hypothetical protein
VVHSEGMDDERIVAIPRFHGGSPHPCRLWTVSFWPPWQALICTGLLSGFMGPCKPTSLVTTLSNHSRPTSRWFSGGRMRHQDDGQAGYRWEPRLHPGSRASILT